jgi:uncharacterized protein (DUF2267 family)
VSFDEFVVEVERRAGLSREDAERGSVAVLQEFCDRLTADEARDLLAQLPHRLKTALIVSPSPLRISRDEFVARVARELEIPPEEAHTRIRAVFATLRQAVSWGAFEDVLEQLDPDYADLLA